MTSRSSKDSSTVKPLSDRERAAWAAYNEAEEEERYTRFQKFTFREKLQFLEQYGRFFTEWKERREAARRASKA